MKIAVPVNEKSVENNVCESFGRAPYFLIFDLVKNDFDFIDNDAADSQSGAGIKAAQIIVDSNSDVLLTPRCGGNAADILEASKVEIYKTRNLSVIENIEAFNGGKLAPLEEIHPGFHNHG
jgi:predicted Fe-Mo cluster-binding NifX family protein